MVDILHKVGIKAQADDVYKALATREGLAGWWTTNTRGEGNVVGGVIDFRFSRGGAEIGGCEVKILELAPARQVLWQVVGGPPEWDRHPHRLRARAGGRVLHRTRAGRSRSSSCTTAAPSGRSS